MIKENFFYDDKYYADINELMEDLDIDASNIEEFPDFMRCVKAELEPIVTINIDWIIDRIDEERFPEDDNGTDDKLRKVLSQINFDEINQQIPKLWYESRPKFDITKADLYEHL